MPDSVVHTIRTAEDIGKKIEEHFIDNVTAKSSSKISNLHNDVQLFSTMYISCQARDSDMDAFFRHENHAWPPSLALNEQI